MNFSGPYGISKWNYSKLLNRREILWTTFVNIMAYGGYVDNNFDQVWKFQVIWKENIYKILSRICKTSNKQSIWGYKISQMGHLTEINISVKSFGSLVQESLLSLSHHSNHFKFIFQLI